MSDEFDMEKLKRHIRQGRMFHQLNEAIRRAQAEVDAEDAEAEAEVNATELATVLDHEEAEVRGLTYSRIRAAFLASLAEDEERGHRGSKVNVAKRLNTSESTLVRAWSDLHGGDPPEWPTGLNP